MNITLSEKYCVILKRLTDEYNCGLAAIGTSLRWSPEDLALRILQEGIKSRVDFMPGNGVNSNYPK